MFWPHVESVKPQVSNRSANLFFLLENIQNNVCPLYLRIDIIPRFACWTCVRNIDWSIHSYVFSLGENIHNRLFNSFTIIFMRKTTIMNWTFWMFNSYIFIFLGEISIVISYAFHMLKCLAQGPHGLTHLVYLQTRARWRRQGWVSCGVCLPY